MKLEGTIKNLISRLKINKSSNVIDITTELKKKHNRAPVSESNISLEKNKGKVVNIEYGKTIKIKNRQGHSQTVMKTGTDDMPDGYRSFSTTDYKSYYYGPDSILREETVKSKSIPNRIEGKKEKPLIGEEKVNLGKDVKSTDDKLLYKKIEGIGTDGKPLSSSIKGQGSYVDRIRQAEENDIWYNEQLRTVPEKWSPN